MPSPDPSNRPHGPTAKQLRYLRALAHTRAQTFTYPRTKAQASAEIRRLEAATAENRIEREVERDRLQREVELPADPTAVGEDEITGHGANPHWSHHREEQSSTAGQAHELARYQLPDGSTRALIAQRINGRVAITDLPAGDSGRVYLVERHIESRAAMDGLIRAYVEDSTRRGEPAALVPAELREVDDA
jgi:hypothetical protein